MGIRAIQAKIECDWTVLEKLWRTHCVFNERVQTAIDWLFRMRRGECGGDEQQRALYQEIGDFIIAAPAKSNFFYLMNSVSMVKRKWKPDSAKKIKIRIERNGGNQEIRGETWATRAAELQHQGVVLYNKDEVYGDIPSSITSVVLRNAAAAVSSYDEQAHMWQEEYAQWEQEKKTWKQAHPEYMKLQSRFADGERERGGRFAKRAERDHAYLDWLEGNPDLAAWRGGEAKIVVLDAKAKERVAKAKRWKQATKRAQEFWKVNQELHELHKLHIYYEKHFARRRKTRRNKWREGFRQRPTFTRPDAARHPRWVEFNAPQTNPSGYKNLVLPAKRKDYGFIKLNVLTGAKQGGEYPSDWVEVRFRCDPRLAALQRVKGERTIRRGKRAGQKAVAELFRFYDKHLGISRDMKISGLKLIFRNRHYRERSKANRRSPEIGQRVPVFTIEVKDEPLTNRARQVALTRVLPLGLVSAAVDLDARGIGFFTRAVSGLPESEWTHDGLKILQSRNLVVGELQRVDGVNDEWAAGPTLEHIRDHKRDISRRRRLRGKPVKGEISDSRLQDHITNMGEDRFKKAARKIVDEALRGSNHATGETFARADVLIMEDLKWFNPDAARERGINRVLAHWNRANLVKFVEQFARDVGLRFRKAEKVSAWGTSQVCSKCGAFGKRYRVECDPDSGKPTIRFAGMNEPLPLFACPNPDCRGRTKRPAKDSRPCKCGNGELLCCPAHPLFTCNADHNASINLHRKYILGDRATAAFSALSKDESTRRYEVGRTEDLLRPALEQLHGLRGS